MTKQEILFDHKPEPHFDGVTYDPALDHKRLTKQLGRVYEALVRRGWYSLSEIAAFSRRLHSADSEAGISARIRDLRKKKFGGYEIQRRRRTEGTWEYKMETK